MSKKRADNAGSKRTAGETPWTDKLRRVRLLAGLDRPQDAADFFGISVRLFYYVQSGQKPAPRSMELLVNLLYADEKNIEKIR